MRVRRIDPGVLKVLPALLAAVLAALPLAADAHGRGGHGGGPPVRHGGWAPAPYWGGVGIGIGVRIGAGSIYHGAPYGYPYPYAYPWIPGAAVVVAPPPVVHYETPAPPNPPAVPAAAEPIVYPRNGQGPEQTEVDRRDCNRWATTQPGAMADASVFQRATLACLDGRGYTVR